MTHPQDDDLILHFYGEHTPDEAARIDAHLQVCTSCDDAWRELRETMQLVNAAEVPEPSPAFERLMWARIAPAVTGAAVKRKVERQGWMPWRWLAPMAGVAAIVMAMVYLRPSAPTPTPSGKIAGKAAVAAESAAGAQEDKSRRVLLTALDGHFAQTEVLLVELLNGPNGGDVILDFERGSAGELLADGRLYRLTAEHTGERRLAQMLEDLESVLVEVARSPDKVKQKDMKGLRSRIDDNGLLFKVRAVTNEIRERQQEMNTVTANEGSL